MIRSYRWRRLIAPTVGLTRAVISLFFGLALLLLGFGLGFKKIIVPGLVWANRVMENALIQFVGPDQIDRTLWLLGGGFLLLGCLLTFRGAKAAIDHFLETLVPGLKDDTFDVYRRRQQLAQGPRIVAIGGGTGLSTLLRGLKQHSSNITAVVTVTDDGGSSGRLIKDKGMIPPGDIRNCLVALADAEKSMTDLFQHRFKADSGSLSGHAMGNLLIAALVDQANGDFERAVTIASSVLAIRGRVVPSTLDRVRLRAEMEDGTEICGETAIVEAASRIRRIHLDPEGSQPTKEALEAIKRADLICIGPGSVYTSIIPNLIVPGFADALYEAKGAKVYVCNVMTQPGESDDFSASQHVSAILNNVEKRVFDYVLVNNGVPSDELLTRYRESDQHLVEADVDRIRAMGLRILQGNFMSQSDFVRHDPMQVASRLISLVNR